MHELRKYQTITTARQANVFFIFEIEKITK